MHCIYLSAGLSLFLTTPELKQTTPSYERKIYSTWLSSFVHHLNSFSLFHPYLTWSSLSYLIRLHVKKHEESIDFHIRGHRNLRDGLTVDGPGPKFCLKNCRQWGQLGRSPISPTTGLGGRVSLMNNSRIEVQSRKLMIPPKTLRISDHLSTGMMVSCFFPIIEKETPKMWPLVMGPIDLVTS